MGNSSKKCRPEYKSINKRMACCNKYHECNKHSGKIEGTVKPFCMLKENIEKVVIFGLRRMF